MQNTDGNFGEADYFWDIYKEKPTKTGEAHIICSCVHRKWSSSNVDRSTLTIEREGIKPFWYET